MPEQQIDVRLENIIIITDKGTEIVSDSLPMGIDEAEKIMQSDGLLKKYPRLSNTENCIGALKADRKNECGDDTRRAAGRARLEPAGVRA